MGLVDTYPDKVWGNQ